jgi:hypothetical protein
LIEETDDFKEAFKNRYSVNRDEFGQDCDLKETNLSIDTAKQLAAEKEEIQR